jgi:antitoxin (DNA-binding transcriptional repressor) of toxin-antitoxin stability system
METVSLDKAQTHLDQLLERVAQGESFTIARHGVPVAALAVLHSAIGLDSHTLRFHREDPQTTHKGCPGKQEHGPLARSHPPSSAVGGSTALQRALTAPGGRSKVSLAVFSAPLSAAPGLNLGEGGEGNPGTPSRCNSRAGGRVRSGEQTDSPHRLH